MFERGESSKAALAEGVIRKMNNFGGVTVEMEGAAPGISKRSYDPSGQ